MEKNYEMILLPQQWILMSINLDPNFSPTAIVRKKHNPFVKQYNIILKCLSKKNTGPECGTAEFDQVFKKKLTFFIKLVPINEAAGTLQDILQGLYYPDTKPDKGRP